MSNISSISSTLNPYQIANQNGIGQFFQDFKALGNAVQSGTLASAQSALATFQQDLPGNSQTSANQPFGKNTQANTDYQSLVTALKSNDLAGAKQAFASLQTDLKAARGHHHHHGSRSAPASTAATSATSSSAVDTDGDNDGSRVNATA